MGIGFSQCWSEIVYASCSQALLTLATKSKSTSISCLFIEDLVDFLLGLSDRSSSHYWILENICCFFVSTSSGFTETSLGSDKVDLKLDCTACTAMTHPPTREQPDPELTLSIIKHSRLVRNILASITPLNLLTPSVPEHTIFCFGTNTIWNVNGPLVSSLINKNSYRFLKPSR